MEHIKLPLESIRLKMNVTRPQMAEALQISVDRYNRLASGESKMLAVELVRLHEVSQIPYENIEVNV